MKRNWIKMMAFALLVSLVFVATVPLAFAASTQTQGKEHTIKGILEPHKGSLVLRDMTSGIRYHLAGKDVSADRGKMIQVTGQVTEDPQGEKTINVTAYELVKK